MMEAETNPECPIHGKNPTKPLLIKEKKKVQKEVVPNASKAPQPTVPAMEPVMYDYDKSAIFYAFDWSGTVKIDGVTGWYRSNQSKRPHGEKWKEFILSHLDPADVEANMLDEPQLMRVYLTPESAELGLADGWWDGSSFYFSPAVGFETYEIYRDLAVKGQIKTNKKVWDNRFAKEVNMTYDELVAKYPATYGKKAKTPAQQLAASGTFYNENAASTTVHLKPWPKLKDIVTPGPQDPTSELLPEEGFFGIGDEEPPWEASAGPTAKDIDQIKGEADLVKAEQFDDYNGETHTLTITIGGAPTTDRVSEDILVVRGPDNKDHEFAKVMIANDATGEDELWILERGKTHEINGMQVLIQA